MNPVDGAVTAWGRVQRGVNRTVHQGLDAPPGAGEGQSGGRARRAVDRLGVVRFSGLYGLVVLAILFWRLLPSGQWLTSQNLTTILSEAAVSGILALAALVPISAGMLDISFANIAGFSSGMLAWLCLNLRVNDVVLIVITVVASSLFGLASGLLVAKFALPSLIVTLGMLSVALAVDQILLGGNTLFPRADFSSVLTHLGSSQLGPIPISALVAVVIGIVLYLWIEHTPSGRHLLATGGNPVAAGLAGIRCGRIQILSLALGGAISGLAGVVLLAQAGTADDVTAAGYLLPAIAALFLGTTQIKFRFNVVGTLIAVLVLQTGIHGIELLGANQWVNYVFDGTILVLATVLSRGRSLLYGF